jgi:ribonucleoside-diphosphate reductase alpha chain
VVEDIHPIYRRYQEAGRSIPPDLFQTAWDVAPEWHLKVQAAFQKHTDNAVSKTVNFPASATVADIRSLFEAALQMPVKGVTVYRDQSRRDQTLSAFEETCPSCT